MLAENLLLSPDEIWDNDGILLATCERSSFSLSQQRFIFPQFGVLISKRPSFNFRIPFEYYLNNKLVGRTQKISPRREIGQLVLLPVNFPLYSKVIVLALGAREI